MAATGTPTPNIGLRIPQGTDPASVDDINYNSNLLDTKLGAVGNTSVQDQIDTLNSNITFNDVTSQATKNTTNVNGTDTHIFKSSVMVIVQVNVQIATSISANAELYTGLPIPKASTSAYGSMVKIDGTAVPIKVTTNGKLIIENSASAGWYNGNIIYPV